MIRWAGYAFAVALAVAAVFAAADLSTRSGTCMACHEREASFSRWMASRLAAEKKGFSHELISCAACHIEGAVEGTTTSRFRGLLHAVKYLVPQIDPRRPRTVTLYSQAIVPTENCSYCHLGSLIRKTVQLRDLTPGLQKIGLVMDHRKHVLAREDTCAKCHERYKGALKGEADKGVNYAEVNHLSCRACHSSASHAYRSGELLPMSDKQYLAAREASWGKLSGNPRWMVPIPSEQTCRRCHDGKIHYKTKVFEANCRTGDNFETCVKCHPIMTKEYFEQHRKELLRTASRRPDWWDGHLARYFRRAAPDLPDDAIRRGDDAERATEFIERRTKSEN